MNFLDSILRGASDATKAFLGGGTFQQQVEKLVEITSASMNEIDDEMARFDLVTEAGRGMPVYIGNAEPVVTFVVNTPLMYPQDKFPDRVATHLLRRNSRLVAGAWQLRCLAGREVCCLGEVMPHENLGNVRDALLVLRAMAEEFDFIADAAE